MPKRIWTQEKIIDELRSQRVLRRKFNPKLYSAARTHFGSFRNALAVAGLPCRVTKFQYTRWSRDLVISSIQQRSRAGKDLTRTHIEQRYLYTAAKRWFGSWTAAREAAGLPIPIRDFYSPDEVQLIIIDLYEKELPLNLASQNSSKLRRSVNRHFGSWRKAVRSLGLEGELPRIWTEQSVIDALVYRHASGLRLCTTRLEDGRLFNAAVSRFGSWRNALEAAGLPPPPREKWDNEKVLCRLRALIQEHRRRAIEKVDIRLADAARRRFGTLERALAIAGDTPKRSKTRCVR